MPKISCVCGYVHNLSPIPDEGYVVIKDKEYEKLIEIESERLRLSNVEQYTTEWNELVKCDQVVNDYIERLYECPQCGRLFWKRNSGENYIYDLQDKKIASNDTLSLSEKANIQIRTQDDLFKTIDKLINSWCNRRCLGALRCILKGWPLISGLTDDWARLMTSLQDVQAFARNEIDNLELELIQKCEAFTNRIVYRK
jgi:hypothetical protein